MIQVICPVCGAALAPQGAAWRCVQGHCFDVARQGYVNLLTVTQKHSRHPGDTREMVAARRAFLDAGWYAPIAKTLADLVRRFCPETASVLDAGCGEGYYLSQLGWVPERWGIDISRDAVRYAAVRLLYELLRLPDEADTARCPARQVECVREAETLVLQDLSVRRPARELADHFGLSESGFKLYCQNVLGEGYLAYFRRRRLERAAELLRTTPQRVQDIAARVGYESQGRFAQAFYDQFRLTPLEYRRLSK